MPKLFSGGYLKGKSLSNHKFRRQYSVGPYVLDFYCPNLKLAIEVDGATHATAKEITYDQTRQKYIESFGIRFLRFTNIDVYENVDGVVEEILTFINNHPQTPP